ncbi:MAG: AtpZ/AtpI family protein [Inquilinaceae bacterium]
MNERDGGPPSGGDRVSGATGSFERRLQAAKDRSAVRRDGPPGRADRSEGMAAGLRIAVELLAAVGVGAAIGIVLDRWLGTAPWLLILFFVIGTMAGFLSVYRTARELDRRARERRDKAPTGQTTKPADPAERN